MSTDVTGRERILVERDGEELEVYNHVSVAQFHYVNSANGHETFDPQVSAGDSNDPVEYVTERIADYLYAEFNIDVEDQDIEVINLESDDVEVI